ncbi:hypothetical protein H045_00815 [Pseudomonas poae RE*1-1-14]|nr:hypothetical protein H045_00815 [Pseudomonas poae RE*1-1-14]
MNPIHCATCAAISVAQVSTIMPGRIRAQWSRALNLRNCLGQLRCRMRWQYGQSKGSWIAMAFSCQGLSSKVMSQWAQCPLMPIAAVIVVPPLERE